jgi:phage virion morphogenesis protein
MAGATVTVSFQGDSIAAGFRALQKLGHEPAGMLRAMGSELRTVTEHRFETARDPQGNAWKPWSPGYAAITKSISILRGGVVRRGSLMGSLTFDVQGHTLRLGSNKIYAAVHQFGATIVPKNAKALFFPMMGASGHVFGVRAKKVTIPARPYLGFGPADRAAVLGIVRVELQGALRSR